MKPGFIGPAVFTNLPQTVSIFPGDSGQPLAIIHEDGRVILGPQVNVGNLADIELYWLRLLREIVNTAIYDKEHPKL